MDISNRSANGDDQAYTFSIEPYHILDMKVARGHAMHLISIIAWAAAAFSGATLSLWPLGPSIDGYHIVHLWT
jgi:hypothetical protein